MDEEDFSSDSSDEDYVPNDGEQLSEEEESGEEEDFVPGQDDDDSGVKKNVSGKSSTKLAGKSKKKTTDLNTRRRKGGIRLEEELPSDATIAVEEPVINNELSLIVENKKEEHVKKKADDLWSDFLKDVGGIKNSPSASQTKTSVTESVTLQKVVAAKPATVKVTKEYDFAGETVTIVKEVSADSKEARLASSSSQSESTTAGSSVSAGVKRPSSGGLSSVLNKIGKKDKISVLEKSKIDWDGFKHKEGIVDELKIHNRGKDGYLERQAFLNRTDHRQFEIERSLRLTSRPTNPTQPKP